MNFLIQQSRGGLAIVAMLQLLRGSFLRSRGFFLKNMWHFKDFFYRISGFFKDVDSF
jgi:hypothetical protein